FEERMVGLADAISAGFAALEITSASVIGTFVFVVFAAASLAQLVTGQMLDRLGARPTPPLKSKARARPTREAALTKRPLPFLLQQA
ncbi:MAG: hypothetical protein AAFO58_06950, partial [Pseudomonadota bacterium]